nr:phage tail tape measure protein [Frigoribacterium sp. CG_9.8]
MEEERAATQRLTAEEAKAAAETTRLTAAKAKLQEQLDAARGKVAKINLDNAFDKDVRDNGVVAASKKRAQLATTQLTVAEKELQAVQRSSPGNLQAQLEATNRVVAAKEKSRAASKALQAAEDQPGGGPKKAFLGIDESRLPRVRYALYDVSFAAAITGTALVGAFAAAAGAAISFEKDFAQVQRTVGATGQAAQSLKADFIDLSQSIPVSFSDLSAIGTLGGQLNIAANDLTHFTKVTAQFSATTNVTIEASGTALGRLNQLLPDVNSNYEALASSILKVGVNSVATESQIIAISQNIAGISGTVGLTTDEVIGLSGALASIGIAPEAARSTVTRLFISIQEAINGDTAALAKFGALSGQTGDQFRAAFKADAGSSLVDLLTGVNASGDSAIATLQALGLTSTRDIPALLKLAQNTDILQQSLGNAADGFKNADELSAQYGITNDTLAAKLTILSNTITAMFASIGGAAKGPLNDLVLSLTDFFRLISDFAGEKSNQPFIFAALAIVALTGVIALAAAGTARFTGSLLALRTFMLEATAATAAKTAATAAATAATAASTVATGANAAATGTAIVATNGLAGAQRLATVSSIGLKAALISTGIGALIVLIGTAAAALVQFSESQKTAGAAAKEFFGDSSSISTAMAKDQAEYAKTGKAITTITTTVKDTTVAAKDWVGGIESATGAQVKLNSGTTNATEKIRNQTIAYGENTKAALANELANNKTVQKLFDDNAGNRAIQSFGGDPAALLKASIGDPVKGGADYVTQLTDSMANQLKISREKLVMLLAGLKAGLSNDRALSSSGIKIGAISDEDLTRLKSAAPAFFDMAKGASAIKTTVTDSAKATAAQAAANNAVGVSAEQTTAALRAQADAATGAGAAAVLFVDESKKTIDGFFQQSIAAQSLVGDLSTLGGAFVSSGATAALGGSALSSVLTNIVESAGSGPAAAGQISALFSALIAGGFASVAQLTPLLATMGQLTGVAIATNKTGADVNAMLAAMKSGAAGASKGVGGVGKSASGAAKQIRTLADYGNDLSGVFRRMNEMRFAPQTSLDGLSKSWLDIASNSADAKEKIDSAAEAIENANQKGRDANATLSQLAADKSNSEYYLRVATMYGDAERVKKIQADLAKNASDTAAAQADLSSANGDQTKAVKEMSDAQEASSTSLTGNSAAAIENRGVITDLVSKYQDLIGTYASTGMPADQLKKKVAELKAQFIAQATQAGFSRSAILDYASSFDDMTLAINRIPRNITVGLDITGVDAAIAEFEAKLKAANASGGGGGGGGGGVGSGFDFEALMAKLIADAGLNLEKTIVFNGDTILVNDALKKLYTGIDEKAPKVKIGGQTKGASQALGDVLKAIERGESYVSINGKIVKAELARDQIVASINKSVGTVNIDGNTVGAGDELMQLLGSVNKSTATVTINGTNIPAKKVLSAALAAIDQGRGTVTIDGRNYDAKLALQAALDAINLSKGSVKIEATWDRNELYGTGALLAAGMRPGFVNYFQNNPISAAIQNSGGATLNSGTRMKFFDQGGYTGGGGKYDARGIVHAGEYVFPQESVRYYGVENLARMHQRSLGGYANGGPVGGNMPAASGRGSSAVSEMSASDRMFFRNLFQEFAGSLTVSDGVIAQAANAANARLVRAGVK